MQGVSVSVIAQTNLQIVEGRSIEKSMCVLQSQGDTMFAVRRDRDDGCHCSRLATLKQATKSSFIIMVKIIGTDEMMIT